ncbi:MAG TPA: NAD(P)/FAD-dependent oxidoreductase [Tepidiformaceae bacterium]|nr:NAD(P)/FAD-dependent oxidoreductase [Tepidiformaceae bacterium]
MPRKRVVIIGAGFGGLECAKKLAGKPVDVLIVDRHNYHLFTPLLYQVASSLLNPSDIAQPVRAIFRGKQNVRFLQGEVSAVDPAAHAVRLADGSEERYDRLVIAAGSTTNFFGVAGADAALGLKDLSEALELRNHILSCLERAARSVDEAERRRLLTFVVVGGGPTGVEYAGALSELLKLVLPREYPELKGAAPRIVLIEALPEILNAFPSKLGSSARGELGRKGVEVRTATRVMTVQDDVVALSNDERIEAATLVWAAGVRPSELAAAVEVPRSRSGRLEVDEYLRVRGPDGVYAIGDIASFVQDGREVPMLSAPAMQEGRAAAKNILHDLAAQPLVPFRYRDKGSMATIGRNDAVAKLGPLQLTGFLGWMLWLWVHLYYLIGFRNRLAVLIGWAWNYVRFDRPVRIIARAGGSDDDNG